LGRRLWNHSQPQWASPAAGARVPCFGLISRFSSTSGNAISHRKTCNEVGRTGRIKRSARSGRVPSACEWSISFTGVRFRIRGHPVASSSRFISAQSWARVNRGRGISIGLVRCRLPGRGGRSANTAKVPIGIYLNSSGRLCPTNVRVVVRERVPSHRNLIDH
jgi:hypothetical protein